MVDLQLIHRVTNKVAELVQLANATFKRTLPVPKIFFDCHRLCAGYQTKNELHFNPNMLAENVESFIASTVPHETAHYIQWEIYPESLVRSYYQNRRVHGREWKKIMRLFEVPPKRCHTYDTTSSKKRHFRKYSLFCGCGENHQVTLKIINKIAKGKKYKCLKCNGPISVMPLSGISLDKG